MSNAEIYIGLMSGTSLDAIDAVAVRFTPSLEILGRHSHPLAANIRQEILALSQTNENELERTCVLNKELGECFSEAVLALLDKTNIEAKAVTAIGSHGQTLRHQPQQGFSLQLGDASIIAERTGITTIADFRSRDIAAGGQGAPLVPAFHQALFHSSTKNRLLLNIGGMANLSYLPKDTKQPVLGYDTGPGNVLLDIWCQQQQQQDYDKNGQWAASGQVNEAWLEQLLALEYFQQPAPKSTGRDLFNADWIAQQLKQFKAAITAVDVQATLLELTAKSIAAELNKLAIDEIYICGGGANNQALITRIADLVEQDIYSSEKLGLHPDWMEAVAFAWLAQQNIKGDKASLPEVTGAKSERILGAVYQA